MGEHGSGTQPTGPDRAEALAALRKAAGLERLLGRLRAGGDDREAALHPGPAPFRRPATGPGPAEERAAHAA